MRIIVRLGVSTHRFEQERFQPFFGRTFLASSRRLRSSQREVV